MSSKFVEYEQAAETYRFFHEYRMKILNFTLALNAALLVVVVQHIHTNIGQIIVSVFSMLASLALFGFEIRTIRIAHAIWDVCVELESNLSMSALTKLRNFGHTGIPQRYYVWVTYSMVLCIWIFVLVGLNVGLI